MLLLCVAVIILVVGLLNVKRINEMFNKPTVEELVNYQESVFLHIDEEISKYKKDINNIYETDGKPMILEVKSMLETVDSRIKELNEIERRIDEKIVKLNQFKNIL